MSVLERAGRRQIESVELKLRARPAWNSAIGVMLASRLMFLGISWLALWLLATTIGPTEADFLGIWRQWDADHILGIAQYGYTDPRSFSNGTVFFPLYPLLVKALAWTGIGYVMSGIIISAAASTVAFYYLFRLAEDSRIGDGRKAILYLAFFPTAVFLVAPYQESLFLAGAIPAFYYARRSEWARVALPAAVAVGARNTGLFLLVGLLGELFRQRKDLGAKWRQAFAPLAFGAIPFALYAAYLWRVKGHPLYFITDYRVFWQRSFITPWESLSNTLSMTEISSYPTNWMMATWGELLAAAIALGVVGWAISNREWGYALFCGSLVATLLTGPFFWSVPRSLLQMFPTVLMLVEVSRRQPARHEWILVGLASIATLGVIVYTAGNWFY
jgi:Gpi18-like mannosyltransferase